jgi:hypothetical protein
MQKAAITAFARRAANTRLRVFGEVGTLGISTPITLAVKRLSEKELEDGGFEVAGQVQALTLHTGINVHDKITVGGIAYRVTSISRQTHTPETSITLEPRPS